MPSRSTSKERSNASNPRTSPTRAPNRTHYAPAVPSQLREAHWPPPTPLSAPAQVQSQVADDYFSTSNMEGDRPAAELVYKPSPEATQTDIGENDRDGLEEDEQRTSDTHTIWAKASGYSGNATPIDYGSFLIGAQTPVYGQEYPGGTEGDNENTESNSPGTFAKALRQRILYSRTRMNTTDWISKTNKGVSLRRM